ncbi:MAG: ISAs1 family transposase [Dolichospermum sp.]
MGKKKKAFRRPDAEEQEILDGLEVRLIEPEETARFNELVAKHHYLKSAALVGEHMRYVATYNGEWFALGAWNAGALHIRGRDEWIGWNDEQRRRRLPLVVNNARLLGLPGQEVPNLMSRFMKGMLARLNTDWQERWGHAVAVAETFVDPFLFQGTCYKVSGWMLVGETAGYARGAKGDFYQAHNSPKHLWVKELEKGACQKLRAAKLPEAWEGVESSTAPHCRAKPAQIMSLVELLEKEVSEFRRNQALTYPVAGMLALIAIATFSGVVHGQRDLAAFGRTCSQAQLGALKFHRVPRSKRREPPGETTFMRVLAGVDAAQVERALLLWQDQVLGPETDPLIAVDGKKLRHAGGVELVSAFGVESGRWMGSVCTKAKSNEIPAARELLEKIDVQGKTVVFDALHTQHETARAVVFDGGGDYVFTVKDNQSGLKNHVARLLEEQPFPPS